MLLPRLSADAIKVPIYEPCPYARVQRQHINEDASNMVDDITTYYYYFENFSFNIYLLIQEMDSV